MQPLFSIRSPEAGGSFFSPTADAQRFLVVGGLPELADLTLNLVVNWPEKLKRLHVQPDHPNPGQFPRLFREKQRNEPLQAEALPKVRKAIDDYPHPYMGPLFKLLLLTGLRLSEIRTLRWENVDLAGATIRLVNTKAGDDRIAPLSPDAIEVLRRLPRRIRVPHVFPGEVLGNPISKPCVFRHWQKLRNSIGMPNLRLHDLRHTVASRLANAGAPAQFIQKALGHKSLQTTMRYIHNTEHGAREALEGWAEELSEAGP